jgi:glucan-binding YG repeat protein
MKRKTILSLLLIFVMSFCIVPVNAMEFHWTQDINGWRYIDSNGIPVKSQFKKIDGKYYYFDDGGYMLTGWQTIHSNKYFFKNSGEMAHSEWVGPKHDQWVDYYGIRMFNMWVDNGRYYVDNNGYWDPNKKARSTGWKKDNNGWWFSTGDGMLGYAKNCFMEIDRQMYYFNSQGYMMTGWQQPNGPSGKWMYFGNDGAQRHEQWVGNYWVDRMGYMVTNAWVDDEKYYVGANGAWIPDYGKPKWKKDSVGWWYDDGYGGYPKSTFKTINGQTYYFNSSGYMVTGWFSEDNYTWYFLKSDGAMKKNAWEGNYWLGEDGIMMRSSWVDGGRYYVGPSGEWQPVPPSKMPV